VNTNGISVLVRDPFNKFLHQYYFAILFVYGVVWALIGIEYFYYGFVFPIFVAVVASNLLNMLGHSVKIWGYRSYNTSDRSSNNWIMGYLGFGEGWHNNHHRYPGSARFGLSKLEFDPGFFLIKIWEKIGLVHGIKVANNKQN
jgi:stearoyl-CoA desaturase (delta-9 desaturase)